MTPSERGRGGRSMLPGSIGSRPSASEGSVSDADVEGQQLQHGERKRNRAAAEREHEERHDLGSGVSEDVLDELADIVIDLAARLDRDDDRREVVVGEHHRRCLPRDVGPGATHRHADVRRAQRRRVVDAIAGHRHHVSLLAQSLGDLELGLG